jgi:hypothetical protein
MKERNKYNTDTMKRNFLLFSTTTTRDSVVATATALLAGRSRGRSSSPGKGNIIPLKVVHAGSEAQPTSYPVGKSKVKLSP